MVMTSSGSTRRRSTLASLAEFTARNSRLEYAFGRVANLLNEPRESYCRCESAV